MAKFKLNKPSKRQPARQRYKIEKKVRDHNRKKRKEAKKNPKKNKPALLQVPNICPFKEDILREVAEMKKQKEEERQRQRELAKAERDKSRDEQKKVSLESLVANAEIRGKIHDNFTPQNTEKSTANNKENSLKAYYKEFRKVIEAADIVLEVLDARDPLGTRCMQVENTVREMGSKRLVLILNKADLVPRKVLDQWLKYLKRIAPAVPFKASTQDQSRKLGQKKLMRADKSTVGSMTIGAEMLMSLLGNYCRNKGIKTSITVGIVGLPNVGKSSIINSLKRSRACNVGATPGVTKSMQEVQLDSKIKLLDSPGIVFAAGSDASASLRNAVKVSTLTDPVTPANAILQRVTKEQMMELYDITNYESPEEFYALKAARMGRFKKGGVPDTLAAARNLLEDWNSGKIKYYTVPPEDESVHISSEIVTQMAKEFDLDSFEAMETDTLNKIPCTSEEAVIMESLGPVEGMEEDAPKTDDMLSDKISVVTNKKRMKKAVPQNTEKKNDKESELEGNRQLNKLKKLQFKKEKKQRNRRDKVATQLSAGLENFSLSKPDTSSYDFSEDFNLE